ncbi:MAG: CoA ester lyase [Planctomycetota bacterium]|nr:MAG: CoA ester lyase [Planctomycetota bacterium]
MRRRRSALFLPASNPRALAKARELPCDALILDLEDSVAPEAKEAAREAALLAAASGAYAPRELAIRCNALGTPWHERDVELIAESPADALVVPKVDSAAELADLPGDLPIWAMLETPAAILAAREIAESPRVAVLLLGTNDLARELYAQLVPGRAPLLPHLAQALLAARAAAKPILDGVFNDIRDLEGFAVEAEQGFQMGFDGKALIHPRQIEPCNAAWTPSSEQLDAAQSLIDTWQAAQALGKGVAVHDGRMIEELHVAMAKRSLALGGRE